jgi:uncharacterized ion transporter superfamily protein YfcC
MRTRGHLRIHPGAFEAGSAGEIELVVAYTRPDVTRAVLDRVAGLTQGLNARLSLIAVHTVPYPIPFTCPSSGHAFLVEQLIELCDASPVPATAQVVLARTREDGFRHALKPESAVLLGARKHFWPAQEEALARALAEEGHQVTLIHVA